MKKPYTRQSNIIITIQVVTNKREVIYGIKYIIGVLQIMSFRGY